MRTLVSGGLIAAALGTAMAVTGAMSASAQVARPQSALATDGQSGLLTLAKMEHSGGGGGGGGIRGGGGGGGPSGGMPLIRNSGPGPITHSGPSSGLHSNVMPQHMTRHDNDRDRDRDRDRHHRRFVDRDFFFFNSFAFAPDYDYPDYYYDNYGYDDGVAYCLSRFRTYDLATHTYIGLDGLRHRCP